MRLRQTLDGKIYSAIKKFGNKFFVNMGDEVVSDRRLNRIRSDFPEYSIAYVKTKSGYALHFAKVPTGNGPSAEPNNSAQQGA